MASGSSEITAPAISAAWSTPDWLENKVSADGSVRCHVAGDDQRPEEVVPQRLNWMTNSDARAGLAAAG